MSRFLLVLLCAVPASGVSWTMAGLLAGPPPESAAADQSSEALPRPQWIGTPALRQGLRPVVLRSIITLPDDFRHARVEALADFADAQLLINGEAAGDWESYQAVAQWDVTRWLKAGENALAISATATGGPAAVALRLTWHDAQEGSQTHLTDAQWRSPTGEAVSSYGRVGKVLWEGDRGPVSLSPLEDYTQWKRALNPGEVTEPSTFVAPPGFEVQLLHTARPEEGSWVAMAFDPEGRLTIAREQRGLLRLSLAADARQVSEVELINDSLQECRGLLYHDGHLYANANNSKQLYRLSDTTADGRFDQIEPLLATTGGVGHGRNALALGHDRQLYAIHGDSVDLPADFVDRTSPAREHRRGQATSEGHLLRIRQDGQAGEILAAGLRNPFGLAFNCDGEAFTYDADAEHDMGAPWYRATRIKHLITGGDFGWRGVTGKWPPYYPDHCDNAPAILEVGRGSPTAVKFASGHHFPPPYADALFILDWSYGRVIAVRMEPRGSSYACLGETFLQGRPLNVTGLEFGPDGAMYLITGGRKTQSALYRIRYGGAPRAQHEPTPQQQARRQHAQLARAHRQQLQDLLGQQSDTALQAAWAALGDADPWLRHVARTLLEHQPLENWGERALQAKPHSLATATLLTLARCDAPGHAAEIAQRLTMLPLESLAPRDRMAALYTGWLCLQAQPENPTLHESLRRMLERHYPSQAIVDQQRQQWNLWASRVLVQIAPQVAVPATVDLLLHSGEDQRQQMHYLFVLRTANQGWTDASRRLYFRRLRDASYFEGGAGMPDFLSRIREEALATLSDEQRVALADLLEPEDRELQPSGPPRPLVRRWTLEELESLLAKQPVATNPIADEQQATADPSARRAHGRRLFVEAQCASCHRFADQGRPLGPDLTHVARRFSPRDLLQSIATPSEVIAEPYRNVQVMTQEGQVHVGRVLNVGDFRDPTLRLVADLAKPDRVTEIDKQTILEYRQSPLSPMPDGLLDTLTAEEILDLLAYLNSE